MAQFKLGLTPIEKQVAILEERLDGFSQDFKVLLAEMNIMMKWVKNEFGVDLVNMASPRFKLAHKNDLEMERLSRELSLLETEKGPPALPEVTKSATFGARNIPKPFPKQISRNQKNTFKANSMTIPRLDNVNANFAASVVTVTPRVRGTLSAIGRNVSAFKASSFNSSKLENSQKSSEFLEVEELDEDEILGERLENSSFVEDADTGMDSTEGEAPDPLAPTGGASRRKQVLTPRDMCPVQVVSVKGGNQQQQQALPGNTSQENHDNERTSNVVYRGGLLRKPEKHENPERSLINIVPLKNLIEPKSAKSVGIPLGRFDFKAVQLTNLTQPPVNSNATPIKRRRGRPKKVKLDDQNLASVHITQEEVSWNTSVQSTTTASASPNTSNSNGSVVSSDVSYSPSRASKTPGKRGRIGRGGKRRVGRPPKSPKSSTKKTKKHECTTCGKKYTSAFILEEHVRIHTGERPYVCDRCPAAFRYRNYYHMHLKLCQGSLVKDEPDITME